MSTKDEIGDRIKLYEAQHSQIVLKQLPVIVRLDGRSFHSLTKNMERPYDIQMSSVMVHIMSSLVKEFVPVAGYTQSDEITLLFYSDSYNYELPFGGKVNKINSVFASHASVVLERLKYGLNIGKNKVETFDCRTFNVPSKEEAANCFFWREQDATKNAIQQMAGRSMYSHKELQNKNQSDIQEMLFQKGKNFNDYPTFFKRGTWAKRKLVTLIGNNGEYTRTMIKTFNLTEPFCKQSIEKRIGFLFEDQQLEHEEFVV